MSLEKKRRELDLKRVQVAKEELLFKIEEKKEDISRLEEHVKIQEAKEKELVEEINKLN